MHEEMHEQEKLLATIDWTSADTTKKKWVGAPPPAPLVAMFPKAKLNHPETTNRVPRWPLQLAQSDFISGSTQSPPTSP
jgi:hypothetical protein